MAVALIGCAEAIAAPLCSKLFTANQLRKYYYKTGDQEIIFIDQDRGVTETHRQTVVNIVKDVSKMVSSQFKTPNRVTFELGSNGSGGMYLQDLDNNTIKAFYRYQFKDAEISRSKDVVQKFRSKNPQLALAIMAHEYGHAIFELAMETQNKSIRELYIKNIEKIKFAFQEKRDQLKKEIEAIESEIKDIEIRQAKGRIELMLTEGGLPKPELERSPAVTRLSKLSEEKRDLLRYLSSMVNHPDIETPYNELFADLVAVLWKNDGQAMSRVFSYSGMQEFSRSMSRLRDFTSKHEAEGWKHHEVHDQLSPTRHFLWKYYLKNGLQGRKPAEILRVAFKAITDELKSRYSDTALYALSSEEVNQRIMTRIKFYFNGDR